VVHGTLLVFVVPEEQDRVIAAVAELVLSVGRIQRLGGIPLNHAVAGQRQSARPIPLGRVEMRPTGVDDFQDSGQAMVGSDRVVVSGFSGDVSDDVGGLESRCELVLATQATDGWKLVLEVWLAPN